MQLLTGANMFIFYHKTAIYKRVNVTSELKYSLQLILIVDVNGITNSSQTFPENFVLNLNIFQGDIDRKKQE